MEFIYGCFTHVLNNGVMVLYWTVFTSHKSAKGPLLLSKHWTCIPLHPLSDVALQTIPGFPNKLVWKFRSCLGGQTDRWMDRQTDRQTDTATC